jgi:hypothetical protein
VPIQILSRIYGALRSVLILLGRIHCLIIILQIDQYILEAGYDPGVPTLMGPIEKVNHNHYTSMFNEIRPYRPGFDDDADDHHADEAMSLNCSR